MKSTYSDFFTRVIFLSLASLLIIFLGWPMYGTTDDNILAGFVDGSYTGEREKRLIFIRPLIGNILYFLQGLIPGVGMYSTFLTLMVILSFSIFGTLLFSAQSAHNSKNLFQYSWYSVSFFAILWFTLTPTYTAASILVTTLSLLTITTYIFLPEVKKNVLNAIMLGSLLACGFLIRPEGALGVLPVSLGIILFLGLKFKKANIKSLALIVATFCIFILSDYYLQSSSSNSEWKKYDRWNGLRHQVQHRVSQNYLGNLREQINWSIPEYHLFMDLSFGDEKVFDYEWLKPGFELTNFTRGVDGVLNASVSENIAKMLNLISKYYYLILVQTFLGVLYLSRSDLSLKVKTIIVSIVWVPLLSALYYILATLHAPNRSIFPLLLLPTIFLLTLLASGILEIRSNYSSRTKVFIGFFVALISIALGSSLTESIKHNLNEKQLAITFSKELTEFFQEGVFLGPGNTEIYETKNPFIGKAQWESPKMITVGNWDTFSPYWHERNIQFGITDEPIYEALFRENIYWLSNPAPDTSYYIELYLRENGQNELSRQNVVELQGGQRIFKFDR